MRRIGVALGVTLCAAALLWGIGAWLRGGSSRPGEIVTHAAPSSPAPIPSAEPAEGSARVGERRQASPVLPEGPPASELPPDPSLPPLPAPYFDEAEEPSEALLRAALEAAIAEKLPRHKLSSDELDQLASAAFRLREAQRALRALPATAEHAERRRALRDEILTASADFAYVLEMTPGEFTARVQTGIGIDTATEDEAVPEPEYLEEPR